MKKFEPLFEKIGKLKVGVIGDVMLDTYMWGHVERISPEAPVPIVLLDSREYRLGGAANVALNIQSLGATAFVISMRGDDGDGERLAQLFEAKGINTSYLLKSKNRITTNKTRIISRNQQMMRLDAESTSDLAEADEKILINVFSDFLQKEKPDVVILQDYNKGILTQHVIEAVIDLCKKHGVITAVDPKRKNFFAYKNVDIFKPNLKEIRDALNKPFGEISMGFLKSLHEELKQHLHHHISFITLSEKGVFYQEDINAAIIPSHLRNIADVSGAGDTVIAVAALVYGATKNMEQAAQLANLAGGIVCEEVGTAAINKEKLQAECEALL